jgi:hypothetical protein
VKVKYVKLTQNKKTRERRRRESEKKLKFMEMKKTRERRWRQREKRKEFLKIEKKNYFNNIEKCEINLLGSLFR